MAEANRKKAQPALDAHSILESIIESTADGIMVLDSHEQIVTLNRKFLALWKVPANHPGVKNIDVLTEMILKQLREPKTFLASLAETRARPDKEWFSLLELSDGRLFERYSIPRRLSDTYLGRVLSYRDVTERHKGEAALRDSEERFRVVFEFTDVGIALIGQDGRILKVNSALVSLLGYSEEEIIRVGIKGVTYPEDLAPCWAKLSQLLAGQIDHYEMEKRYIRKDGKIVWCHLIGSVGRDSSGIPTFCIGMLTDVTERRRHQEERDKLLVQEWNAHQNAIKAVRLRDDFIAIASHELRTPLTPLKLQIQFLRKRILTGKLDAASNSKNLLKMLDISDGQLDRLEQVVEDLLDASRIRAGQMVLAIARVELSELVERVVNRMKGDLERAGCALTLELANGIWGHWDRSRIEQVIGNLVTNAMKYGSGTPVSISTVSDGGTAKIIVRDHGIGIPEKDRAGIFEEFERKAPVESFGGFGLGLYIARQIVLAHRGTIGVESQLNEGATFTVTLPQISDA